MKKMKGGLFSLNNLLVGPVQPPELRGGMIACTCMVPTLAETMVCTPSEPWS